MAEDEATRLLLASFYGDVVMAEGAPGADGAAKVRDLQPFFFSCFLGTSWRKLEASLLLNSRILAHFHSLEEGKQEHPIQEPTSTTLSLMAMYVHADTAYPSFACLRVLCTGLAPAALLECGLRCMPCPAVISLRL